MLLLVPNALFPMLCAVAVRRVFRAFPPDSLSGRRGRRAGTRATPIPSHRMFDDVDAVARFDAFDERLLVVVGHVDHVDARLVHGHRVERGADADVRHDGRARVPVAIAVDRQVVHHVDEEHVALERVEHGGRGFGHGLEEGVLVAAERLGEDLVLAGVQALLAARRGHADRNVLQRAAEPAHHVPFEVGEHGVVVVVREVRPYDVGGDAPASFDRNLDFAVLVLDVAGGDVGEPVLPDRLPMVFGGVARARIGGVAFDDRAVEPLDEVLDERGLEVMRVAAFPGAQFDGHFAVRSGAQRLVDANQAGRADVTGEIDLRGHRIIGLVFQRQCHDCLPASPHRTADVLYTKRPAEAGLFYKLNLESRISTQHHRRNGKSFQCPSNVSVLVTITLCGLCSVRLFLYSII